MLKLSYEHFNNVPISESALNADALMAAPGFNVATRRQNAMHQVRLAEAFELWDQFKEGRIDPYLMRQAFHPTTDYAFNELRRRAPRLFYESMTTSDFSLLTSQVLDSRLMANYASLAPVYDGIAKVRTDIRDFRSVQLAQIDGMEGEFEAVKENEPFTRRKPSQSTYSYSVGKYEAGYQLSWEAVINDNMGIFDDLPQRLALGGRRSADLFWTRLICDVNGPHATMYSSGNGNIITDAAGNTHPKLTFETAMDALGQMMNLKTAEGRAIATGDQITLMVGDGILYNVAMNIMNTLVGDLTGKGGSSTATIRIKNWVAGRFNVVFNPEIKNVATTANSATSWWLFMSSVVRPATEMGFLNGYSAPVLFRKASNSVRVGGGVDETVGDFDTMSTELKALLVHGGSRVDPKATMGSRGTT